MAIRQHVGALFTDLYEVTMAQAYWAERMSGTAVFEIFFRKLPPGRSYIMAAGLADVVEFLEAFRFDEQDLRYLRGLGQFSDEFLRWLARSAFHRRCLGRAGRNRDFSERTRGPADRANHRGPACRDVCAEPDSSAKRAREQGRAGGRRRARTTGGGFRRAARSRHRRGLQGRAHQLSRGRCGHVESARGPPIWDPDVRHHGAQLCSSLRQ
ncbi:conserved hypothetical protein [Mycobacterium tuberculosis T17]|nr:conserved hypothetical protein [Mycobacterium tuberculosis T17]